MVGRIFIELGGVKKVYSTIRGYAMLGGKNVMVG